MSAPRNLARWGIDLVLRTLGGLTLLFAVFVVMGALTGEGLVWGEPAFLAKAIFFWVLTLPVAVLYCVGMIIVALLRSSRKSIDREK